MAGTFECCLRRSMYRDGPCTESSSWERFMLFPGRQISPGQRALTNTLMIYLMETLIAGVGSILVGREAARPAVLWPILSIVDHPFFLTSILTKYFCVYVCIDLEENSVYPSFNPRTEEHCIPVGHCVIRSSAGCE